MEWFDWQSAGLGVLITIPLRMLYAAVIRDVSKRISFTIWGVRAVDRITPWFLRNPIWTGRWRIQWTTASGNFAERNEGIGTVWRCFNTLAVEGEGQTTSNKTIKYGFIGKFSRDKTVLTGTWFDRRGPSGYHGCYQLRLVSAHDRAEGKWMGFSESSSAINADVLRWEKIDGTKPTGVP